MGLNVDEWDRLSISHRPAPRKICQWESKEKGHGDRTIGSFSGLALTALERGRRGTRGIGAPPLHLLARTIGRDWRR
jgi:hypothetical protein